MALPTNVTIRPAYTEEPIFGVRTNGDTDRISAEDMANAANPLRQIPFVSQVYEAATGERGSAAAKLIGGALIGGPIGFLASLASVVFEQQTGESVGTAIASAFKGEDATVQVASAEPAATAAPVQTVEVEILPPAAPAKPMQVASAAPISTEDAQILSLFGGQKSAHQSYQRAQMLPYLKDVSTSLVL